MKHILYKIYYDEDLIYLGRTSQPINNRLRGHFFAKPMHRAIDLYGTSKIEVAELPSQADMFLYEIYYINKLKPPLNCDDKARDDLTVTLPEISFVEYNCPHIERWHNELKKQDEYRAATKAREIEVFERRCDLRKMRHEGKITQQEYEDAIDALEVEV